MAQELKDIPKRVLEVIEKLLGQGKTDAQILNHYQIQEFVEGNDVCPKGLENPQEKIARARKVCRAAATRPPCLSSVCACLFLSAGGYAEHRTLGCVPESVALTMEDARSIGH